MIPKKPDAARLDKIVADARRAADTRELGYRERSLKMYPWICGRCMREFTHANVSQLTVHHRDHNHNNNPLGSMGHKTNTNCQAASKAREQASVVADSKTTIEHSIAPRNIPTSVILALALIFQSTHLSFFGRQNGVAPLRMRGASSGESAL